MVPPAWTSGHSRLAPSGVIATVLPLAALDSVKGAGHTSWVLMLVGKAIWRWAAGPSSGGGPPWALGPVGRAGPQPQSTCPLSSACGTHLSFQVGCKMLGADILESGTCCLLEKCSCSFSDELPISRILCLKYLIFQLCTGEASDKMF